MVEHELDVIRHADWIVDVGPGCRRAWRPDPLQRSASRLRAGRRVANPTLSVRQPDVSDPNPAPAQGWLRLKGVTRNNLNQLDVEFPLGVFTTVTGVSGSGKSSLVSQALVELVAEQLGHPLPFDERRSAKNWRRRPS